MSKHVCLLLGVKCQVLVVADITQLVLMALQLLSLLTLILHSCMINTHITWLTVLETLIDLEHCKIVDWAWIEMLAPFDTRPPGSCHHTGSATLDSLLFQMKLCCFSTGWPSHWTVIHYVSVVVHASLISWAVLHQQSLLIWTLKSRVHGTTGLSMLRWLSGGIVAGPGYRAKSFQACSGRFILLGWPCDAAQHCPLLLQHMSTILTDFRPSLT